MPPPIGGTLQWGCKEGGQPYLGCGSAPLPSCRVSTVRIVLWAALGLLVLSGSVWALGSFHRSVRERTTIADPVHKIVINADVGDVDVRAGLTPNVVVQRHDSWLLNKPDVVAETYDSGTLTISTKCGGLKSILRCRSDLMIDAPPEVDVVVRGDAGDVDLRGLSGRADVKTSSGDIRTHRLNPVTVRAQTDAGNVSLDLVGQPTRTDARSDAGNVRVVVPFGPYRVDASAGAGNVKVEGVIRDDLAPQAITALTDAGDITVRAR